MIFYGISSSRLKNGKLNNVNCPSCNNQTSMTYSVFGKYTYIYWIPIFPVGKTNILECDRCKKTYKLKQLPDQIKQKFELEKHQGIPLKHFIGLGIILLIVAAIFYSSSKHKEQEAIFIKSPKIGDVYHTKGSNSSYYTSVKVVDIKADSIFIIFNEYEVDKKSGINSIDKSTNYKAENTEGLTIQEVQNLYKEEIIFNIERD